MSTKYIFCGKTAKEVIISLVVVITFFHVVSHFYLTISGLIDGQPPEMAQVDFIAHVVVMPIVLAIGMLNQCLNICTLLHLPSGCFMFLKASAIADILSIASFVPFLLRHAQWTDRTSYFVMSYHAHVELPLINGLITASALNIVGMTIDRYISICHPIKFFHSAESKFRSICISLGLYLAAALIYAPSIIQKKVAIVFDNSTNITTYELVRNTEVEETRIFKGYLFFRECACRWGPVIVLVVLNLAMVRSLQRLEKRNSKWGRRSTRKERISGRSIRSGREDRGRISILLLVTSTTFIICNLPASLLSLFINRVEDTLFWQIFRAIANLLQVTSYLYNFYLYALCSSEYRQAFLQIFGCSKPESPSSTGDSPTIRMSVRAKRAQVQSVVRVEHLDENMPLADM